jgi:putative transposase
MSDTSQSLAHSRWNGTSHVVVVPQRRRQPLYGTMRKALGALCHELARQKAGRILAGHVMPDHGHSCLESPPQHAVASVRGLLQGKSAIAMARQCAGRERHVTGDHFWARGYAVATVGCELEHVRASLRDQEATDEEGRFSSKTQVVRSTACEAALLIKPPALPGVSDYRVQATASSARSCLAPAFSRA